jgi:hypothetical protein
VKIKNKKMPRRKKEYYSDDEDDSDYASTGYYLRYTRS